MLRSAPVFLLLVACSGDDGEIPDPCEVSGNICTWLGVPGEALFSEEGLDRKKSRTYLPQDVDFASDGTAYFPDFNNHRIRKVGTDGVVDTVSGTGFLGDGPNDLGSASNCWEGCDAMTSAWNHPTQLAVKPGEENLLYVAAWHNSRINIVDLDASTMTWMAGTGGRNYAPGELETAVMDLPSSIVFAEDGTLYFSDQANHLIRRITPDGVLEDVAGQPRHAGYSGDGGPASEAELHGHTDQKADPGSKMAIDGSLLYVSDTVNGMIRVIDLDTMTIDRFAGRFQSLGTATYVDAITGVSYETDAGNTPGYGGDGGDALDAVFDTPRDVAVGPDGELYVADTMNDCIRVIRDGVVETYAGRCGEGPGFDGEGVPAVDAVFAHPFGLGVDPDGNVYVADTENQVLRRIAR